MNQPIMLLAYVLLWTSFLIIGSVVFFHAVFATLTLLEIVIDLVVSGIEKIFNKGNK